MDNENNGLDDLSASDSTHTEVVEVSPRMRAFFEGVGAVRAAQGAMENDSPLVAGVFVEMAQKAADAGGGLGMDGLLEVAQVDKFEWEWLKASIKINMNIRSEMAVGKIEIDEMFEAAKIRMHENIKAAQIELGLMEP